jgi:uncharacterized membrane protein HdeD (DUF308 family)
MYDIDSMDQHVAETEQVTRWWWVFLITGVLWLILSLIVFRFDLTSVTAIGVLVGCFLIFGGVNEFVVMAVTDGGWKWVHGILGGIFIVFGIVALFHPGSTFIALASIMGWVLLFKGILDIAIAFMVGNQNSFWWLRLLAGGVEIGLAFWAAGYFGRKAFLVVVWVGAWALMRGITEIVLAFEIRSLHKKAKAGTLPAAAPAGPDQAAATAVP